MPPRRRLDLPDPLTFVRQLPDVPRDDYDRIVRSLAAYGVPANARRRIRRAFQNGNMAYGYDVIDTVFAEAEARAALVVEPIRENPDGAAAFTQWLADRQVRPDVRRANHEEEIVHWAHDCLCDLGAAGLIAADTPVGITLRTRAAATAVNVAAGDFGARALRAAAIAISDLPEDELLVFAKTCTNYNEAESIARHPRATPAVWDAVWSWNSGVQRTILEYPAARRDAALRARLLKFARPDDNVCDAFVLAWLCLDASAEEWRAWFPKVVVREPRRAAEVVLSASHATLRALTDDDIAALLASDNDGVRQAIMRVLPHAGPQAAIDALAAPERENPPALRWR